MEGAKIQQGGDTAVFIKLYEVDHYFEGGRIWDL